MAAEKPKGGKREGQKYKSLLVWDYLLKNTDESHAKNVADICAHLELYGIEAERHSVSRDVKSLMELMERDADVAAGDIALERDLLNYVVEYDAKLHGYKVSQRPYEFDELRLLAECVRASKFITAGQEKNLLAAIEGLCSEPQIEELKNEVYLVGRTKANNKQLMSILLTINSAIRHDEKISFKYQKYTLQSNDQQVDRRQGARYTLSPFKLIINEGNYYLLAYDAHPADIRTYRLDRMKDVKRIAEPREGAEVFSKVNLQTYTQRVFSMFGGQQERVSIRFVNPLLDAVIDRFGTGLNAIYKPDGDSHFILTTDIEISDQFYAWVCGFRKKATILDPPGVVEGMNSFLKDIAERYETMQK